MKNLLKLLQNKQFKRFFIANFIAYVGINVGLVGINWIIIDSGASNQMLATYTSVSVITTILISFICGSIIDRYNRFLIMKITVFLQGVILIGIFVGIVFLGGYIWFLLVAAINSTALVFYNISSRGALQYILKPNELIYGNTAIEICIQGGAVLASLFTGIIYNEWGYISIFVSIISSTIIASFIIKEKQYICDKNSDNYLDQLKDGLLFFENSKLKLLLGIVVFLPGIVTLVSNNVLPGYVKQVLEKNSVVYGMADMIFGIGAFIAGVFIAEIIRKIGTGYLSTVMFIISIVTLFMLALIPNEIVMYLLYFLFGLSNTSLKIILNTIFMKEIPEDKFARCFSMCNAVSSIMQIILVQGISVIMDSYSPQYGYTILGALMLITLALFHLISCQNSKVEQ